MVGINPKWLNCLHNETRDEELLTKPESKQAIEQFLYATRNKFSTTNPRGIYNNGRKCLQEMCENDLKSGYLYELNERRVYFR